MLVAARAGYKSALAACGSFGYPGYVHDHAKAHELYAAATHEGEAPGRVWLGNHCLLTRPPDHAPCIKPPGNLLKAAVAHQQYPEGERGLCCSTSCAICCYGCCRHVPMVGVHARARAGQLALGRQFLSGCSDVDRESNVA